MTAEQRYTLTDAQQELNRECAIHGHDTEVVCGLYFAPVKVSCRRCGDSWDVQPKATA